MRFTKTDNVKGKRCRRHNLKDDLERFLHSGMRIVVIDFHENEYSSLSVAYNCIDKAIKRHGFTNIRVFQNDGKIYLERLK